MHVAGSIRPHRCRCPGSSRPTATTGRGGRGLPEVLRAGCPGAASTRRRRRRPYWRRYLYGQRDLARLNADEVARKVRVPASTHGCSTSAAATAGTRRGCAGAIRDYPRPCSTCPAARPSAARSSPRRAWPTGCTTATATRSRPTSATGTTWSAASTCVHHLAEPDIVGLFGRVRAALAAGGTLAVLDAFRPDTDTDRRRRMCSGCSCT